MGFISDILVGSLIAANSEPYRKKVLANIKSTWPPVAPQIKRTQSSTESYQRLYEGISPGLPEIYTPNPKREGLTVPEWMILDLEKESGFHFGMRNSVRYVGKPQHIDGHIAVFGGSGSGKSYGIAKPTIQTWKAPVFAIDIKGELEDTACSRDRPRKVLSLTQGGGTCKLDPFYWLFHCETDSLVQNAEELAHCIIPLPSSSNTTEVFFLESARDALTGAILHYCYLARPDYDRMSFIETMIEVNRLDFKEMVEKILSGSCETAKAYVNKDDLLNPKMYAGISSTLKTHLRVFATDRIVQDALSPSDDPECEAITWEDLKTHDIFIQIEQRQLNRWGRVLAMLVTQLIRALESRPDKHSLEGEATEPVLLLLDEFPQLGKMEAITDAMATLRSRNVTLAIFCQSLADLDSIYGVNTRRRIMDNCPFKAVLRADDPETQTYFSDLVGTINAVTKGISCTYNPATGNAPGIGLSLKESSQVVIPPHEFSTLHNMVVLHPEGFSLVDNLAHSITEHPPKISGIRYLNPQEKPSGG